MDESYLIGYLLASQHRKKVLLSLKEKAITPSIITEKTGLYPSHVSLALTQLVKKNLIVCLTPKLKKGRLYELTKKGQLIISRIT